jgi:outer membrane lipoprotein-sorting protein
MRKKQIEFAQNSRLSIALAKKTVCLLAASLFLSHCSTFRTDLTKETRGHFEGKALVRDKAASKSQVVNVDVKAKYPDELRLDVTSPLGSHLFSFVMVKDKIEYMVVPDKRHFYGTANSDALMPVLKMSLDPVILQNIFFERPIESKSWTCVKDGKRLASCKALRSGLSVEWAPAKKDGRLVSIESRQASVQIHIKEFKNNFDESDSTFKLKVPKSFTSKKLQ